MFVKLSSQREIKTQKIYTVDYLVRSSLNQYQKQESYFSLFFDFLPYLQTNLTNSQRKVEVRVSRLRQ